MRYLYNVQKDIIQEEEKCVRYTNANSSKRKNGSIANGGKWVASTDRQKGWARKKLPTKHSEIGKQHWTIVFRKRIYSVAEQIDFCLLSNSTFMHTHAHTTTHRTLMISCTSTSTTYIRFVIGLCTQKMQIFSEQMFNQTKHWYEAKIRRQ